MIMFNFLFKMIYQDVLDEVDLLYLEVWEGKRVGDYILQDVFFLGGMWIFCLG